jgi:small subunit ribosomal protein S10
MNRKNRQKIKILLQGFDYRTLDVSAKDIADTAKRTGAFVSGPTPLPTRIERFTVNRSPHVDKKSMDQFEIRTHRRLIEIYEPSVQTIEELKKLNLSAGSEIKVLT